MPKVELELGTSETSIELRLTSDGEGPSLELSRDETIGLIGHLIQALDAMPAPPPVDGQFPDPLIRLHSPNVQLGWTETGKVFLQFGDIQSPFLSVNLSPDAAEKLGQSLIDTSNEESSDIIPPSIH